MRALSIQKLLLATVATFALAAAAQAQDICTGSGIHQSCVNKSGSNSSYTHNGKTTQASNYTKGGRRIERDVQKTGSAAHNQAAFGTQLTTATSVKNAQLYNGNKY